MFGENSPIKLGQFVIHWTDRIKEKNYYGCMKDDLTHLYVVCLNYCAHITNTAIYPVAPA